MGCFIKRFHQWLGTALLAFAGGAGAEQLTVMTSYPQAVVSRFEAAFESNHPDIRLDILWRMPHDALPYLLQPEQGGVDVYWSPSLRTFRTLKEQGALGPIGIDRSGLPQRIGNNPLADPDGTFIATETAGYGIFITPEKLAGLGLNPPDSWQALADPRLYGQVVLPVPSQVGYAPMLIDQLLQNEGWKQGWAIWHAIAANSRLLTSRGNFVTDEVASGRAAAGLTMDFFAASAIASGAPGRFVYPQKTAFNPAHIAITASTPNRQAAEAFVAFVTSPQGQKLLFHPDIRKLPIRPSVYSDAPAGYANPFELAAGSRYDDDRGLARRGFIAALFDAALTRRHGELVRAWKMLQELEAEAAESEQPLLERIRTQLTALPMDEPPDDSPLLQACAKRHNQAEAEAACASAEREWDRFFERRYHKALALLGQVLAGRGACEP
jgi:ABC-type Fe3+ transport system substrate-binding protein